MLANLLSPENGHVIFFDSDTSGEKPFEEFYSPNDSVDWATFDDIGVITVGQLPADVLNRAERFIQSIQALREDGAWTKQQLVDLIVETCPGLDHVDTGKFLDEKM